MRSFHHMGAAAFHRGWLGRRNRKREERLGDEGATPVSHRTGPSFVPFLPLEICCATAGEKLMHHANDNSLSALVFSPLPNLLPQGC